MNFVRASVNTAVATIFVLGVQTAQAQNVKPEVELLHWWTSSSAKAVLELRKLFEQRGGLWKDTPVAGENVSASTTLRARILAGNPPEVSIVKGPEFQEWGKLGKLNDIQSTATAQHWDDLIAPALRPIMKYQGNYVGVPINIHRNNWMIVSPVVLEKVGEKPPKTWDEYNRIAKKISDAGIIPLAGGGEKWQEATVFETVSAGFGADWYRSVFLKLDESALKDPKLVKVFEQLREMTKYRDAGYAGRNYEQTAFLVTNGQAGFQFMGDWLLAGLNAAGKQHGKDYVCVPAPSFQGDAPYVFNTDSFGFFKTSNPTSVAGQKLLAELAMSKEFQTLFNRVKGSIPARSDVDVSDMNPCQVASKADYEKAVKTDAMLPSWAHSMAVPSNMRGAMLDTISEFINSKMSAKEGAERLREAINSSR